MKRYQIVIVLLFCCFLLNVLASQNLLAAEDTATEIFANSQKRAGLCVHIGVSDGVLTDLLSAGGGFLVHGLTNNDRALEESRNRIQKLGSYGRVSVEKSDLKILPYANDMVNLLVISDARTMIEQGLKVEELLRVLAPMGVACFENYTPALSKEEFQIRTVNHWTYLTKPVPAGSDEWTHTNVNISGNRVSGDLLAEPPERLRWIAGVEWVMPDYSAEAMVVGGGRVFYIINESPSRKVFWYYLSVRDAFSGVLLWKHQGTTNPLTMIVHGEQFLICQEEKMVALESATGKVIKTYDEASKPNWAVIWKSNLLVSCGVKNELRCIDLGTGGLKWKVSHREFEPVRGLLNSAIQGDKLYYKERRRPSIGCIDLLTGSEIWNRDISEDIKSDDNANMTSFQNNVMVLATNKGISAFSAVNGEHLWDHTYVLLGTPTRRKGKSYMDGFFIKGLFWTHVGDIDPAQPENRKYSVNRKFSWQGLDPLTGEVKKKIMYPENVYVGASCFRDQATQRWFMGGYSDFVSTDSGQYYPRAEALHTSCHIGVRIAYGLIYNSALYMPGRFIQGDMAVEGGKTEPLKSPNDPTRLEKGIAFESFHRQKEKQKNNSPNDWPTYRYNGLRTSNTTSLPPSELSELWSVEVGTIASAPTIADGRVFISSTEDHRVWAFDSKTGDLIWNFTADGRVKKSPTVGNGLCLFGSSDGYVYALEAASGKLVWRFLAARTSRKIVARERVESTWPVAESVLLHDGYVCFIAGRHGEVDGGKDLFALEASTGKFLWHKALGGNYPSTLITDEENLLVNSKIFLDFQSGNPVKKVPIAEAAYESRVIDPTYRIGKPAKIPIQLRSLIVCGGTIFATGRPKIGYVGTFNIVWEQNRETFMDTPDIHPLDKKTPLIMDYKLWAFSASDGKKLYAIALSSRPTWDSLAMADGKLYVTTEDGRLHCIGKK